MALQKHTYRACPHCGQPLRSDLAKQCFLCGMDWHDPNHVVKRGDPTKLPDTPESVVDRPYIEQWLSDRASNRRTLLERYGQQSDVARLIAEMQPGDEIRAFNSPEEFWQHLCGRFGYALVRDGKPVSAVVVKMN